MKDEQLFLYNVLIFNPELNKQELIKKLFELREECNSPNIEKIINNILNKI